MHNYHRMQENGGNIQKTRKKEKEKEKEPTIIFLPLVQSTLEELTEGSIPYGDI